MSADEHIEYDVFAQVDIRAGVIVDVQPFPRARKPSHKIQVDFGPDFAAAQGTPEGTRWSSAQTAGNHSEADLLGRQVLAVVNFKPRNIAGFSSEILILGVTGADGELDLLTPSRPATLGSRVY
ncbi:MAG: tRNA-binding protein [Stackebrandtia sp.]